MARVLLITASGLALAVLAFRALAHLTGIGAHTITTVTAQSTTVRHVPVAILPGSALAIVAVAVFLAGSWIALTLHRRG